LLLSQAFLVGIPSWMGFSRPQLVVVSGIFLRGGISAIIKPFSRTFFFLRWNSGYHGAFLTNFLFLDGILAITKPFSRTLFLFSRWNSGYHEAFLMNFLFSRWNSGYHEAFLMNFLFSRWNSGYHGAFLTNFLFHDGILEIHDLGEDSFHIYISQRVFT
jgi:hypothetical protein